MPLDLGRRLLAAGAVLPGEVRRAVFAATSVEAPFARALADSSATVRGLLATVTDATHPSVRAVIPDLSLVAELPPGLPARLLAVPMRRDARTGTLDIAVVDPSDAHLIAELAFHTGGKARLVAAPLPAIESALLLIAPPKRERTPTADFEAAPPQMPQIPQPPQIPKLPRFEQTQRPPETQAVIGPITQPREDAIALVRRSQRASLPPPRVETRPSDPPEAMPLSRTRVTLAPPTTAPFEQIPSSTSARASESSERESAPVQMVVDFRRASRAESAETAQRHESDGPVTKRRKLEAKRPPFPSLTRVLENIDAAKNRAALIEALLHGLITTSSAGALFAPRRGKFVGVGAIGEVEPERMKVAAVPLIGAVAEAIAKNERLGTLDPNQDLELYSALGLERFSAVHVLIQPSFVADKAALLLVTYGLGDVLESTRRARVLSTAAAAALERLLRK